ncbi:hypothetical protein CbuK_1196 [Coxiella burnetii CbuK_Q154]|nr:hypothetical protein CbuG_0676 [Coxiella burnetii CbuG_Q212]ACJ20385.1 hypothetical protein CbuK_1196 [Coxiella burnetii CbuK_Q154]
MDSLVDKDTPSI